MNCSTQAHASFCWNNYKQEIWNLRDVVATFSFPNSLTDFRLCKQCNVVRFVQAQHEYTRLSKTQNQKLDPVLLQ